MSKHTRIAKYTAVRLTSDVRRNCDWTCTKFETIAAGTEGIVVGIDNRGFQGVGHDVELEDGRILSFVAADDLIILSLGRHPKYAHMAY